MSEYMFCPLCNYNNSTTLFSLGNKYKLLRCNNCRFVFILPRPSFSELEEYYNTDYKYNYTPKPISKVKAKYSARRLDKLIIQHNPKTKTVLEIGCSFGSTIYGLEQHGYQVAGTDLSKSSCDYISENYDIKAYNSEFPPVEEYGNYDALIISQLIEHIIEPVDFLKSALIYLKNDGLVFIATPNIDCFLFNIFRKNYHIIRPPEHINFFNSSSIRRLFTESGVSPIAVYTRSPIWVDYNILNTAVACILCFLHITRMIKRVMHPDSDSNDLLAFSTGITQKSKLFMALRLSMDYISRIFCVLIFPIIRLIDKENKGLVLSAVGKSKLSNR